MRFSNYELQNYEIEVIGEHQGSFRRGRTVDQIITLKLKQNNNYEQNLLHVKTDKTDEDDTDEHK